MRYKTYDEWKALGWQVQRGEHAVARDKQGRPVFSDRQVDIIKPREHNYRGFDYSRHPYDYGDQEYEGYMEEILGGWDWYK